MIDALFNQSNYLAAKKGLDVVELRQRAIQENIANLETPGYKRVDVSPTFSAALERATAAHDGQSINSLQPVLAVDSSAEAVGPDGNTVNLESELLQMSKNTLAHSLETQLLTGTLQKLRLAISGRPS